MSLRRVLKGDERRRTRLHDYQGNLLPLAGLIDLVPCAASTLLLKLGMRSWSPWLPYPFVRHLRRLCERSWRVLEFGSGASTVWLSAHAAHVVSHEHDAAWHARTAARLATLRRGNVELRLLTRRDEYAAVDAYGAKQFDFVLVDGHWRDACAESALRAVRPGGFVYFDNSDVPDADHRAAVEILARAAGESWRFVGLCPGHVAVNQGLLIRVR